MHKCTSCGAQYPWPLSFPHTKRKQHPDPSICYRIHIKSYKLRTKIRDENPNINFGRTLAEEFIDCAGQDLIALVTKLRSEAINNQQYN